MRARVRVCVYVHAHTSHLSQELTKMKADTDILAYIHTRRHSCRQGRARQGKGKGEGEVEGKGEGWAECLSLVELEDINNL